MRSLAIPRGALYNRVLSLVLCRMILKRSFRSHIAPVMCGTQHGVLERCSTTLWYTADGYRPDKVTDSRLRTLNVFPIKTSMKHRTCTAGPALSAATRPALHVVVRGSQGAHSSEGALRIIWSMACTGALLPDSRSQSALFTNCCRARERLPSKASETTYTVMCEPFGSS